MGILNEDAVLIQLGKSSDEPSVVTVSCPDEAGLGCDLCRIILEFGLSIVRADFSTDGRWCYIVFWVTPLSNSHKIDWDSLKKRMLLACPSFLGAFYFCQQSCVSSHPFIYLLKFYCLDRKGLLHDVTKILTELEFTIQRVKVMTTPDGRVFDLFFITDGMELLHTKKRQIDTCDRLTTVLGYHNVSCEIELAGPEYESLQGFSPLPSTVADEFYRSDRDSDVKAVRTDTEKTVVTVDNQLSPSHTLFQIQCIDQKGLFYDIMRTSKECNIQLEVLLASYLQIYLRLLFRLQIAYGRFFSKVKGYRNMDLFVQTKDGKKILDPKHQANLISRLKEEIIRPLQVFIVDRGPDAELFVANPVELSGKGRPRVFYDVTLALKTLGICIFSAEIARHSNSDRQWEVYRFLLDDSREFPLASHHSRSQIVERVTKTLMGWCVSE